LTALAVALALATGALAAIGFTAFAPGALTTFVAIGLVALAAGALTTFAAGFTAFAAGALAGLATLAGVDVICDFPGLAAFGAVTLLVVLGAAFLAAGSFFDMLFPMENFDHP